MAMNFWMKDGHKYKNIMHKNILKRINPYNSETIENACHYNYFLLIPAYELKKKSEEQGTDTSLAYTRMKEIAFGPIRH